MFIKIPQYKVSRKSVHWEPRDTYRQTDGRGEAKLFGVCRDYANTFKVL